MENIQNPTMEVIIFSSQGNFHKKNQVEVLYSVVSRLSKVSDLLSLSLSSVRCGENKFGVENRTNNKNNCRQISQLLKSKPINVNFERCVKI